MIIVIFILSFLLIQVIICFIMYVYITNRLYKEYDNSELKTFETELTIISSISDSLISSELLNKNWKFETDNSFMIELNILTDMVKLYGMRYIDEPILKGIISKSYINLKAVKTGADMSEFTMNKFKSVNFKTHQQQTLTPE